MGNPDIESTIERIVELTWRRDRAALEAAIHELPAADLPLVVSRLDAGDRCELFVMLDPATAAELVVALKDLEPHRVLASLAPEHAASILHELPSNIETDLIAAMKPAAAERILAELPTRETEDVRSLARYEPDVAGGLMVTEILSFPEMATVQKVVDDLRANAARYSSFNIQYIYVTDSEDLLLGVLKIRDLLLSDPGTALRSLVQGDPVTVDHQAPLEELQDIFQRNRYLGLPVVDEGRLVGVVRRSAVEQAVADRTARQFRLVQGIIGGEEVRSMPVRVRSGRRLAFLSANIVLNVVAASVIVYFEETLAQLIALAAFLPIISDMSGCSGNQAVAVSMRELALGLVRPKEVVRVLVKEIQVGLLNGVALGLLLGLVSWVWRGNPTLGIVVGAALALNTIVAVSIGGSVPLLLKGFGIDPALASGPILTTVTDICGFFLALGFAAFAMSQGYL
ncbi:MAG: magnesium transporter [Holophagae bacterium]|jgi:magnesium transporter